MWFFRRKLKVAPWFKGMHTPTIKLPISIDRASFEALAASGIKFRVVREVGDRLYISRITLPRGWHANPRRGLVRMCLVDSRSKDRADIIPADNSFTGEAVMYAQPRFRCRLIWSRRQKRFFYLIADSGSWIFAGPSREVIEAWLESRGYTHPDDPRLYWDEINRRPVRSLSTKER